MGNRLLPQGRVGALCGHFDAKEFGRPASSGEQNPNEDRANTPRRTPRSRHRNSKLSAAPPDAPGTGLVDQADAASGAHPPAYGLGVAAPLPARAGSPALSSEAPSVSSIDASPPPRRCATRTHRRAARREEDGGGRPPRAAGVPRRRRHREGGSRSQRTVTPGSRRTVDGSSLIQSRGFSPIGCYGTLIGSPTAK